MGHHVQSVLLTTVFILYVTSFSCRSLQAISERLRIKDLTRDLLAIEGKPKKRAHKKGLTRFIWRYFIIYCLLVLYIHTRTQRKHVLTWLERVTSPLKLNSTSTFVSRHLPIYRRYVYRVERQSKIQWVITVFFQRALNRNLNMTRSNRQLLQRVEWMNGPLTTLTINIICWRITFRP